MLDSKDARFGEKPLMIVNDLDFVGDEIFFIDSSYKYTINEAVNDILETNPLGRLFRYNEMNNELEKLSEGDLYFPNGMAITPAKDAILINECSTATISK